MNSAPENQNSSTIPQSLEAEKAILGACLIDCKRYMPIVIEKLKASDFFLITHRDIFLAMLSLYEQTQNFELITIADITKDSIYLQEIMDFSIVWGGFYASIGIVKKKALARDLIKDGQKIMELGYSDKPVEESISEAEELILKLSHQRKNQPIVTCEKLITETNQHFLDILSGQRVFPGFKTGLPPLDQALGGIQPSNLIVIAGRPSMGKTSLMLDIARNNAIMGNRVLFISLEMSEQEIGQRLLCSHACVNLSLLKHGFSGFDSTEEKEAVKTKLNRATLQLKNKPLFSYFQDGYELHKIKGRIRQAAQTGLDMVFIDYLGLIDGGEGENQTQQLGDIAKQLKQLAGQEYVPIFLGVQLNRSVESRPDKIPFISDLRDSGKIEEHADLVLLLFRPGYYFKNRVGEIDQVNIAKYRNGATGIVELEFVQKHTTWREAVR